MPDSTVPDPDVPLAPGSPGAQLQTLVAAPGYWTARAMQEQGSRFFQAIGAALDAADLGNRRLIYATWPAECWDFYGRGLLLETAEKELSENGPTG